MTRSSRRPSGRDVAVEARERGGAPAHARAARAPLGLGLALCAAYYVASIASVLALAFLATADDFEYDVTLVRVLAQSAIATVGLWLLWRRAAIFPRYGVVSGACLLALLAIDLWIGEGVGGESTLLTGPAALLGAAAFASATLAVMLYLALSSRVRAVCAQVLGRGSVKADPGSEGYYFERPLSWHWWRNLGIYYAASSLIGHWGEICFCWLIVLGVFQGSYDFSHDQLWSWWLYPYPAEGIAAVLCVVVLYPLKQWLARRFGGRILPTLVVSFLATMAVCATIDFCAGILFNADYHLWDYRALPFNFMGQIVLQNTLVYSVIATFVVWVLYPWVAGLLKKANQTAVDAFFFAFMGAYVVLMPLYFLTVTPSGIVIG